MGSPLVYDVTAETFQAEVMERSLTVPVLLDFWAEWCGPCKTLGRTIEKLVTEYDGGFVVAKVDSDRETELSQAFRVQSIPFCVLVLDGQPIDGFAGAVGEDEIRKLLKKHGIEPVAEDGAPAPEDDPDSAEGRLARARKAVSEGDLDGAREAMVGFPDESPLAQEKDNLASGLEFLEADLPGSPRAAELLGVARGHIAAGRIENALEAIVQSAAEDRTYGGGLARKAMLLMQGLVGANDAVEEYRRRLATMLY